jgi:signal transduction histidine kinase
LIGKQREAESESQEYALRQEQLRSTGRLAAEVAHQLKNPLSIINNASFTLQRGVEDERLGTQVRIIRDEIERADRIINDLMGYSKLIEGQVEKLNVVDELERAIKQVFPPGGKTGIRLRRGYAQSLPALLAQRVHVEEIFVNLLQNAREAMQDRGNIWITASYAEGYSILVTVRDDGPGIPEEYRERIFEAYFTTKEHGSGVGMAVIKNNVEMYGGSVVVESHVGRGSAFTLRFPGRTSLRVKK